MPFALGTVKIPLDLLVLSALAFILKLLDLLDLRFSAFGDSANTIVAVALAVVAYIRTPQGGLVGWVARLVLFAVALNYVASYAGDVRKFMFAGPREWDFFAFYVDGYVARVGSSLYSPDAYRQAIASLSGELAALDMHLSAEFVREVVDVGFKSPPFSAFVLMPISMLPISTAHIVWLLLIFAALLTYCMALSFLEKRAEGNLISLDRIALCIALVLSMDSARVLMQTTQTSVLVAILLTIALLSSGRAHSGFWAVLAVVFKPLAVFTAPYFLLVRKWKQFLVGCLSMAVVVGLSLAVMGIENWQAYLRQEYVAASPAWLYFQGNTTSLLAEIMRWKGVEDYPWTDPSVFRTFYACVVVLLVPVALVIMLFGRMKPGLSYCLFLGLTLLLYPGTQMSYGVMAAIPIAFVVLGQATERRAGILAAFAAASVVLLNFMPALAYLFLIIVLVWLIVSRGVQENVPAVDG